MANVSYDLHKLGWRAFQDLAAVVLQTVLGQTFHTFADTNDAGRDGAFHGTWRVPGDPAASQIHPYLDGAVVAQCKFSTAATATLTPASLMDEIAKAAALHRRGLCDAYLLLTNLRVTGRTDERLRDELARHGIDQVLILDGQWISQRISLSPQLRRYVPRVYGLGDLGQILDERRLEQAQALLSRLREDLVTFVSTGPYRAAATALADHRFVLLLGEPAAGKSTIAAMLSIAALDGWGCGVRRVDSAAELLEAWNPHEPDQLFWVDDAFGAIRHDPSLTDGWARRLDQVMTAVKGGARVIVTSRDYIYREARPYLKSYAYPLLDESAVVVDVAALTTDEKRRLLYNHLKFGDQPQVVLRRWRPHLRAVAQVERFQPEVARRLGLRAFTVAAVLTGQPELIKYMIRPTPFLRDVLAQLGHGDRAALGCVYVSGDDLAAPVEFTEHLLQVVTRMGAVSVDVLSAFTRLNGTFLHLHQDVSGQSVWRFRHPTIREGFAATIAEDPNAVEILVDGLTDEELIRQVDCGGTQRGTLIRVPPSLFHKVASRVGLPAAGYDNLGHTVGDFLVRRCSEEFLRTWARVHQDRLDELLGFHAMVSDYWQPKVLARLHLAGVLPEQLRQKAVGRLARFAHEAFDPGWLEDPVRILFQSVERDAELQRFKEDSLGQLDALVEWSADGYDDDVSPAERYENARDAIRIYSQELVSDPDAQAALTTAMSNIDRVLAQREEDYGLIPSTRLAEQLPDWRRDLGGRDEFDDLDA